ncbi:TMV resistance protein N-like [Prosopis cineraria]|uniref:TMV resistance protein N-like n=1 Tax=Prosopis cineraria TaxID=364024 RepID=UPI00240FB130|nr:TMV resistance protein N-like [Prosopis cineraria]
MALDVQGVGDSSSCSRSTWRQKKYDAFGITTFTDDEDLERGQIIKPSLSQAIEESSSAIDKYLGLHVFPIFYGVDPSNVRHQRERFAEAFEKHEETFAHDRMKVHRWRGALKDVADLAGWNSENR